MKTRKAERVSPPCICGAYDHKNGSCLNEPTHTPGPWKYWNGQIEAGPFDEAVKIAEVNSTCRGQGEGDANARLIAAAPELLRALKELSAWVNENVEEAHIEGLSMARQAILKAEGRA